MKRELGISKNKPIVLASLILVSLIIIGLQFAFPDNNQIYNVDSIRIANFRMDGIPVSQPWFVLAAIPFVFINLFLAYHINSQFNIISNAYYFPSWLYLIISFNDYRLFHLSAELISSSLLLLSIFMLLLINQSSKKHSKLFLAGFFLAAASLFLPQTLLYIPLIFFGLMVFNQLNLRNSLNFIIGMLSVYFLLFAWSFLTDNLTLWHQHFVFNQVFSGLLIPKFTSLFPDFLLAFLSIAGLIFLSLNSGFLKVSKRKHLTFFVGFLIFGTFAYIMDGFCLYNRFFLALPMAYIFINYLINTKARFLPRTITWIIFIFFIISQTLSVFSSLSGNA
ncbi:MAG: DUF6427 family protein [Bacteroidales bacterium]|jgi:hypothetical protein|nr:DUF6427 family protein [Bacteroidales bacterium]